jgi:hypothetical protein
MVHSLVQKRLKVNVYQPILDHEVHNPQGPLPRPLIHRRRRNNFLIAVKVNWLELRDTHVLELVVRIRIYTSSFPILVLSGPAHHVAQGLVSAVAVKKQGPSILRPQTIVAGVDDEPDLKGDRTRSESFTGSRRSVLGAFASSSRDLFHAASAHSC